MGAISGDELMQWEKTEGSEAAEVVVGTDEARLEKILVSVRLRPLSPKEMAVNDPADWECINDTTIIFRNSLAERSIAPTAYTFDRVFRGESTTREVYEDAAKEVALSVVSGINSTIFAYGQTSSGKTYTMTGITEYTVADIYDYIKRHEEREFVLKFSAIEIYNEAVRDLLSMDAAPLRVLDDPEKGTIVEKLTEVLLRDWSHLKELLAVCEAQRQIGETLLNEMSSRSHQILRLTIESSAHEFLGKDRSSTLAASVNFVDLAGSERASQALSVGNRLKEGCHINRSLLTLGTVIRKLSKGRNGHVPYRDSKLTRILQPSLGGNARTAIICTMSPARSHIEQSRNTLLFASCAKEVVTSARVNVVMSDKALVKHLQKELARLEVELKYPRASSTSSHVEALLREKDAQIKKMEKEIKELTHQRDLAQTRLGDLLRVVGSGRPSSEREESCEVSTSDALPTSESSISYRKFALCGRDNKLQNQEEQNVCTPIRSSMLIESVSQQKEEETVQESDEDSEELCKEVRCIEMDGPLRSGDPKSLYEESDSGPPVTFDSTMHDSLELNPSERTELRPPRPNSAYITLEQHLQDVRDRLNNLVKAYPDGSSPWSSACDSRGFVLSRSRSCRATMTKNSPWYMDEEQNDSTPPCSSHKDFPGRTERFRGRCIALNYGSEIRTPSREESHNFEKSTCDSTCEGESVTSTSKGAITNIHDFVAGLKMARLQYQKQLQDQDKEQDAGEEFGAQETTRGIGLDPIDPLESPSRWSIEFEKRQQEILELWHACNVALVHRTYFFLLFKGDPTDAIYMEVELRRLSFLKRAFSRHDLVMKTMEGGQNITPASSMRRLRREREMLLRQMHRRFSAEERESLYTKWGIALESKQRKWQLVCRLWTETGNLEHVRESASIVAKLIGLLEPGQEALKEMFGLSISPELYNSRRSFKWKPSISSFK